MTSLAPSRPSVRGTLAEQYAPVLRVHAEMMTECVPAMDVEAVRARIAAGQVGYDALRMLAACGDLNPRWRAVLDAFEVAGLLSNEDRRALDDDAPDVDDLVSGWFTGDRVPRDPRRRIARQAAVVTGNALLRALTAAVGAPSVWRGWTRLVCPCCGGAPDIALLERGKQRSLVCARCDAQWRSSRAGCLGCEAHDEPDIVRISNEAIDYDLVMCNGCGRYLKERSRRGMEALLVERALTLELDLAAEQRGLRL